MRKETVYRIFSHIPTLETPRLTLRGMRVSDAEDVFDYASREEVTRYLLWSPHPDIEYTRRYLTYIGQRYRTGDFFDWAMVSRETGHMIGTCGFTSFNFSADSGEIGYVLNPDCSGRGLATEAVREVIRFGFTSLYLHRQEALFLQGNDRSRRLMERVGMCFEGMVARRDQDRRRLPDGRHLRHSGGRVAGEPRTTAAGVMKYSMQGAELSECPP